MTIGEGNNKNIGLLIDLDMYERILFFKKSTRFIHNTEVYRKLLDDGLKANGF